MGCNTLLNISIGDKFDINSMAVLSINFRNIKFFVNYREIIVNLWNGPGQEIFRSMMKLFFKETDIFLFVYDITSKSSFEGLDSFINMANDQLGNDFIGAIVANKSDLFLEEEVDVEQGKLFAKKHNYKFYLVSAKDNQQAFINCLDELVKDYILAVHPDLLT